MAAASQDLERIIERIHRAIEIGAKITWNEKIRDPDNPKQTRQIDITIRRPNSLTIVECRMHSAPQDVQWVEELMGRKQSLRADLVIAVSSSGFTKGARLKAEAFGVVLRDFIDITTEEAKSWGESRIIKLEFYQFRNSIINVKLPLLIENPTMLDPNGQPFDWTAALNMVMNQLDERKSLHLSDRFLPVWAELKAQCTFSGMKPVEMRIATSVRRVFRRVNTSSIAIYSDASNALRRHASIEKLDMGETDILESPNGVHVRLDISQMRAPKSSIFKSMILDMGRPVMMNSCQLIGSNKTQLRGEGLIEFVFS